MQTPMLSLWLPIVASGVALFFASWLAWMILPHHKKEWTGLANEDAVMGAIRSAGVVPGQYMFPYAACSADLGSEEFKAKMKAGPHRQCRHLARSVQHGHEHALHGAVLPRSPISSSPTWPRWSSRRAPTAGSSSASSAPPASSPTARPTSSTASGSAAKWSADIVDGIAYGLITGAIFAAFWPAVAITA